MKHDVIIIGAGIAGLTAARTLKSRNINFVVLEADDHIGGRAVTHHTSSGIPIVLGGHWLHGADHPLRELLDHYQLPYDEDKAGEVIIYRRGEGKKVNLHDWLDEAVDKKRSAAVLSGNIPDCTIPELAPDAEMRSRLLAFARMWGGLSMPQLPSAKEFLNDRSTPGGMQVIGGIGRLIDRLAEDVGKEYILTGKMVKTIKSRRDHVTCMVGSEEWTAKKVLFTGSLGVIKNGQVKFEPGLKRVFRDSIARIAMGDMNRIAMEVSPAFFEARHIPANLSIQLLTGYPHFCHVRSAGMPVITLFIAGARARHVETLSEEKVLAYFCKVLMSVRELRGFAGYIVGKPVVTRWNANPFVRGSYTACLPGSKRTLPHMEGCVYFCGEAFDTRYPGAMAGAARSGKAAALLAIESLDKACDVDTSGHDEAA